MGLLHDAIKAKKPDAEVMPLITPEACKEKDEVRRPLSLTLSPGLAAAACRALARTHSARSPPLSHSRTAFSAGRAAGNFPCR